MTNKVRHCRDMARAELCCAVCDLSCATNLSFAVFLELSSLQEIYADFGFTDAQPVLIGLMLIMSLLFAPFNAAVSYILTALTRRSVAFG